MTLKLVRSEHEMALDHLILILRNHPDTGAGLALKQYLGSLSGQHRRVNLWTLARRLDGDMADSVAKVTAAALRGKLKDHEIRKALTRCGEQPRSSLKEAGECLEEARMLVEDWMGQIPAGLPCAQMAELRAHLGQAQSALAAADVPFSPGPKKRPSSRETGGS